MEPTALESTCIVFSHGLDLFLAPVSPSKQFDMLDVNFNYLALSGTMAILVIATVVLSFLADRKQVNMLWA